LPDDSAVRQQLIKLAKDLRENREQIDGLETKVTDITAKLEQLPALLDREKSFKKLGLEKELDQVKAREARRTYVADLDETLEAISEAVDQFRAEIDEVEMPEVPTDVGGDLLKKLAELVSRAKKAISEAAKRARQEVDTARTAFDKEKAAFDHSTSAEELAFNKEVGKLPAMKGKTASQLTAEYKRVSGDIAKLKPLGAQKTAHETKLLTLAEERTNLLEQLARARSTRWTALGKAVKELNKRLDGQLRVEFEPARIRATLKEFLIECRLDGIGEKRLAWIDEAEALSIADLVGLIRQGDSALMARFKKAGMSKQVADALAGLPPATLRELEELELPERMELLLNVSRDGENYREVGRLSTGQQCTAILHLLLLDNPDPLIIDQPEDNLDNAFIADHIVNELRASKTKRQFIFATHNANIPVFGDAEWIGVLHEEDGHAKLQASGSIDAPEVKDLAANILEGGKEAFTRRREKYGL
jgi:hypothetical protein